MTEKNERASKINEVLKGGVIMDVISAEQAAIAEESGAVAVMVIERDPADIRKDGGVSRTSDPKIIKNIMDAVSIPVMTEVRVGHFVEAQVMEVLGVDYIGESEVLTPADENNHIEKSKFDTPFVCGASDLGQALRRIGEGASMIRTKGEPGTGNIFITVRQMRRVNAQIKKIASMDSKKLKSVADDLQATLELIEYVAEHGKLPVLNFAAGGVATPADAALMMQLGSDGIFVGSAIFKSKKPTERAKAIVKATANYDKPEIIAEVSENLGEEMVGIDLDNLPENEKMADRGW